MRVGLHRLTDAKPSNTYSVRKIHDTITEDIVILGKILTIAHNLN